MKNAFGETWFAEICHDGTVTKLARQPDNMNIGGHHSVVRVDNLEELSGMMGACRRDFERQLAGMCEPQAC